MRAPSHWIPSQVVLLVRSKGPAHESHSNYADKKPLPKISEEVVTKIKAWGWSAVSDEGALRKTRPHAPKEWNYADKKPLPKISEEVVTKIKAWGSVFRR